MGDVFAAGLCKIDWNGRYALDDAWRTEMLGVIADQLGEGLAHWNDSGKQRTATRAARKPRTTRLSRTNQH